MRTAPEEFNLSANQHHHDPRAAEFIRSYRTISFPGARFVSLLESESNMHIARKRKGVLPVRKSAVGHEELKTYHIEELCTCLYGAVSSTLTSVAFSSVFVCVHAS